MTLDGSRAQLVGCVDEKDRLASCAEARGDDGAPGFFYVRATYAKGGVCLRHLALAALARQDPRRFHWPKRFLRRLRHPSPNKERTKIGLESFHGPTRSIGAEFRGSSMV